MTILAVRSIPLSVDTRNAWKANGVLFRRRDKWPVWAPRFDGEVDAVLNLGSRSETFGNVPVPLYNSVRLVHAVSGPRNLRAVLDDGFLPEADHTVPHWFKMPGFGGAGKEYHEAHAEPERGLGDIQKHVDGPEYRIITVGERVVQASIKADRRVDARGQYHFNYTWCGIDGIRDGGFIPFVKDAVRRLPNYKRSVLGWDVIHDGDRPFIIEANTSPGVNEATARRIVRAIEENINA